MTTTNDDIEPDLDIPEYLRIPQEQRARAWARKAPMGPNGHTAPRATAGDVCRRAGIPDGINRDFVAAIEARETAAALAKREEGLRSLAAWKEQQRLDEADRVAVRQRVQEQALRPWATVASSKKASQKRYRRIDKS